MKSLGKISTGLLVIIISLAVVIILSTCLSCRSFVPYNADPNYTRLDKEGFTPLHYGTYPNGGAIDIKNRHLINSVSSEPTAQRVKNMNGLFGPSSLQQKLDVYSDAKGNLSEQCAVKSNGMSNSQGYLCLDEQQLKLLTTRGGNQTSCA
jgi:hypothetical protein|tara:strand:+ start:1044 stop:1493 length:450 start_codon:yes stop_codon:yes gene_type:complete